MFVECTWVICKKHYLFCAQYICDLKQIQNNANLAIQLCRGRTLGEQVLQLDY